MKINRFLITKTVILVLFSLTLLACIFAFGACGHKHEYTEQITKQATCTSVGEKTFTCSCGDSYTQAIDKLDHNFTKYAYDEYEHWLVCANEGCTEVDPDTARVAHEKTTLISHTEATCTVAGEDVYRCVCGHEKTYSKLAPHNFTKYAFDETHHWIVCANEGCAAIDPETEKVEHNHATHEHTDSTCTVAGKDEYVCECGHRQTTVLPLAPHDFTKQVVTSANHWMACSACDAVDPDNPKMSHEYVATETVTAATCTTQGSEKVKCSVCDYESTRQTNALGHDLDKSAVVESNDVGHRYHCTRCGTDVFFNHTRGEDVAADTNKAPTCNKSGSQAVLCADCGKQYTVSLPATGEHVFDENVWVSNGTMHWHVCTNEGCDETTQQIAHIQSDWIVTKEATCLENGREEIQCTVCGYVVRGRSVAKTGHDYEPTGNVLQEATCFEKGSQEVKCSVCGDISSVEIPKLTHVWSEYVADEDGKHHTKICSLCKTETTGEHGYGAGTVIHTATTCGDSTITRYTCLTCGYNDDHALVQQHNYHQIEESYVEGNCSQHTEYDNECAYCGDVVHVVSSDYGAHDMVYFPKKNVTETEDGNIAYWQCNICGRYFSAQYNGTEYFAEDIFIFAPKHIVLESIDQMETFILGLENDTPSYDIYEITVQVVENKGDRLGVWDFGEGMCTIILSPTTDLTNIYENDVITIQGHLILDAADSCFADGEIIDVQSATSSNLQTLNMSVNDTNMGSVVATSETGSIFSDNTNSPQSLMIGETLTFTCYGKQEGAVLKSIIVNGKSYSTDANGQFSIIVTGDVNAQFIYDTTNEMRVTIDNINTSVWNADPYMVNEYLAYEYDGNTNDSGRLYKGSITRFVLNNAYIKSVVIEYQDYKLDEVVNNAINVGTDKDHKNPYGAYEINSETNKATLTFESASTDTYLEYHADASQARLVSITFTYVTHNALATYSAGV